MSKLNNEVVVGIDVAKDFSYFCMIDPFGKKLGKAFKVYHQLDSLNIASKKLKEVEHQYNCQVVLVMESTGHYSKIPFHFFSLENYVVHMVTEYDGLKFLTRHYLSLSDEITRFKNNISSLLEQMLPGYEHIFSDITSPSSLYILDHFSSSDKILHANKEELINHLSKVAKQGKAWAEEKHTKLLNVAKSAFLLSSAPESAEFVLKANIAINRTLIEQQACIHAEIVALTKQNEDICLIRSIHGLGPLSAAIILSELRDPRAFSNPRKLVAFCGIDPSVNESGKFKGTQMKISKRGSKYLRRALYMAALASIKKKANGQYPIPTLADYYFEMIKTKPKKTGLVAVMHKLVNYIFAVLRDRKPFVEYSKEHHMKNYSELKSLDAS